MSRRTPTVPGARAPRWAAVGRLLAAALAVGFGHPATGQRLAIQPFDVTDGLVGDYVQCLLQDSRGELWIGTNSGVSRFDGRSFVSYTTDDGLPDPSVLSLMEDGDGTIWAGTSGGLVRLDPTVAGVGPVFELASCAGRPVAAAVVQMARGDDGVVWAAAGDRVIRPGDAEGDCLVMTADQLGDPEHGVRAAIEGIAHGAAGELWLGTSDGVARVLATGRTVWYPLWNIPGDDHAPTVILDTSGRVWAATARGVVVFMPEPAERATGFVAGVGSPELSPATLPRRPGDRAHALAGRWVLDLEGGRGGPVWAASVAGLLRVDEDRVRLLGEANGLVDHRVTAALEDTSGSVWIGSQSRGVMRLDPDGFVSYGRAQGIGDEPISSVVSGPHGGIVAVGSPPATALYELVDGRAHRVRLALPAWIARLGWGWNQVTFMDSRGAWWVPTEQGLLRYPVVEQLADLATLAPDRIYGAQEMGSAEVFRVWEDARGDLWLGLLGPAGVPWATRWIRDQDRFVPLVAIEGFPDDIATAFADGPAGSVFVGLFHGGVVRVTGDSAALLAGGPPPGFVNDLLVDHSDRLWVAANGGVGRCDHPLAASPQWRLYGGSDGIGREMFTALTEDRMGRVYVGSYNGIWRLDPDADSAEHLDTSSGLVNNHILSATTDAEGGVWFATAGGVSVLRPVRVGRQDPLTTWVDGVSVDGSPQPVPAFGVRRLGPLQLRAGVETVAVSFRAVDLRPGDRPRYRWSLHGQDGPWSPPQERQQLDLAGLAPGRYRIHVRAERSGVAGPAAEVTLSIPAPWWRRWWMIATLLTTVALVGLGAHRVRVMRLEAVQAMRGRIAADLHDELGLSLSRISILSEVARRRGGDPSDRELDEIGITARELMEATSLIAWALDPSKDSAGHLVTRLRQAAADVLEAQGVTLDVQDDGVAKIALTSELRRSLFLILKEAVYNAARHAAARNVTVRLRVDGGRLCAEVEDDGCGFDPEAPDGAGEGHGLANMARRARESHGSVRVVTAPGRGTRIEVELPIRGTA